MNTEATAPLVLTELHGHSPSRVAVLTLNRPKALNALNDALMDELGAALARFDADPGVGCIVITGSEKAFAAGADVVAMAKLEFLDALMGNFVGRNWEAVGRVRKPVIAAVSGFCLGGGAELAMMCDFIIASDTAKFGQPEIKLGVIPGAGGTQRLPRAIGKAKAMDLALTGRMMDAQEAERSGLVARVLPQSSFMSEVLSAAQTIANHSAAAALVAKDCVNRAFEGPLSEGMAYERRSFHALFGTPDQREGMAAFIEKRPARFQGR